MRGGTWLNVAALVTWLICGLPQIVAITQGEFTGWPATAWLTAYVLYGAALIVFLGLGRIRTWLGYYAPLVLITVQMVTALAVVMLPVIYLHTTNSTPGLLVVIAAQLPYLAPSVGRSVRSERHVTLPRGWIWTILGALTLINTALLFVVERTWSGALSYGLSMGGFMLFAAASSFLVQSEAAARTGRIEHGASQHAGAARGKQPRRGAIADLAGPARHARASSDGAQPSARCRCPALGREGGRSHSTGACDYASVAR
jgi:hypothetical protein